MADEWTMNELGYLAFLRLCPEFLPIKSGDILTVATRKVNHLLGVFKNGKSTPNDVLGLLLLPFEIMLKRRRTGRE